MYDINFYQKTYHLLQAVKTGNFNRGEVDKEFLLHRLEYARSKSPVVYNVEGTNSCLHKCKFCPRRRMTRPIKTMRLSEFKNIVDQLKPWTSEEWNKWTSFVQETYGIKDNEMSENHFFLYIIPQVIQMHGYGDDLLNKNIDKFVQLLTDKGLKSYFSTNPTNLNLVRVKNCFLSGLSYIKFSIESVNNELHRELRGIEDYRFQTSYDNICELLEFKRCNDLSTTVVITMLDFDSDFEKQEKEFLKLKEAFKDKDVYIYKKSLDTQWLLKDSHPNRSIHWNSLCKHPWMSMTIKSDGSAASCMEDFDNTFDLGNVKENSLFDIWNGEKYQNFRKDHVYLNKDMRCFKECDMQIIGEYL